MGNTMTLTLLSTPDYFRLLSERTAVYVRQGYSLCEARRAARDLISSAFTCEEIEDDKDRAEGETYW
jgi:hypothetical protein